MPAWLMVGSRAEVMPWLIKSSSLLHSLSVPGYTKYGSGRLAKESMGLCRRMSASWPFSAKKKRISGCYE
jgi:hypothetical protein